MRILDKGNLNIILSSFFCLCLVAILSGQAKAAAITCETNFGEKSFTIDGSTVAFHKDSQAGRSISSINNSKTRKSHTGFSKVLYVNGDRHLIHVANETSFDSNNDYLAITSQKGHKMTYPLNCHHI
jgi:predicted secreted Zn-dependent protease